MLDREALKYITELATGAAGAKALPLDTLIPVIQHRGELVSLEKYERKRSRFRGTFSTSSLAAAITFINETTSSTGPAQTFIDTHTMSADTFFNLGTVEEPGHGDHRAHLTLKATAEYKALLQVNSARLSQKGAVDWITDWAPYIEFVNEDGEIIGHPKALTAIRNIKVTAKSEADHSQKDHGASSSIFEEIEATSKDGIPFGFIFSAVPYADLSLRQINVRLTVNPEGEKPTLTFRIVGLEKLTEEIGAEFQQQMEAGLGKSSSVTLGEFELG